MIYLPIFSRQMWLPGATRSTIKFHGGFREWITEGGWTFNTNLTNKKVEILLHTPESYTDASLNDAIKYGNAAFESARTAKPYSRELRCFAWQFIAYYYSAYFAANAIMRLSGFGCPNLTAQECSEINQMALLCHQGGNSDKTKISPGLYYSSTNSTTVQLRLASGKGGVHIQFWIGFLDYLNKLELFIKASSLPKNDKANALSELYQLKDGLTHGNTQTGSWLSEVRNSMNYRLQYGAWYPYENCQTNGENLLKQLKDGANGISLLPKPTDSMPDPERAVRISGSLLKWLHSSFSTLESNSKGKKKQEISNGSLSIYESIFK